MISADRDVQRKLVFLVPLFFAVVSMAILFIALANGWMGEAGQTALTFCERLRDRIVKQPANTWSNISFMLVGLYIGWMSMKDRYVHHNNRMSRTFFYPAFFATIAVLLGPGSMAMHASTSHVGGYFDMLSMYLIASLMFSYALDRFLNLSEVVFFIIFMLTLAICNLQFFYQVPLFGFISPVSEIFGVFIVSATLLEFLNIYIKKTHIEGKWAWAFSITFLVAFAIWNFSLTGRVGCNPDSWIQGHAIWHILNALAVYFVFRYYVSEEDKRELVI